MTPLFRRGLKWAVVNNTSGGFLCSGCFYNSKDAARLKARELARANPNHEYVVVEALVSMRVPPEVTEEVL